MRDILSILSMLSIQDVTEQYCEDLRQERGGALPKGDRRKLEHKIREFQKTDADTVLRAIVVYAVFDPGEAISYARQKGVFHYSNPGSYAECCLEKLDAFAQVLDLPCSEHTYIRQKLECRWLRSFYEKTEKRLRHDIRDHHKNRIRKKANGRWLESNFAVEMLAYMNMLFRYRDSRSGETAAGYSINREDLNQYSNEEISEAVSYLIYLFVEEKGFKTTVIPWLDPDYILSDNLNRLILLACQRNLLMEWEATVDCLRYSIETDGKNVTICDPDGQLEKSLRIGYVKTSIQRDLFNWLDLKEAPIYLVALTQKIVGSLGDTIFKQCQEDKLLKRYRMECPAQLLEPFIPKKDGPLELFAEEYAEIDFAVHEQTFRNASIFDQMVTDHCSVVDLIRFKRFFILTNTAQQWLFARKKDDIRTVIRSILPVMTKGGLLTYLSKFVGSTKKANEIIELLSWDGRGRLDLQYTPIIKMDECHYFVATDILISSNIIRNSIMLARSKSALVTPDGQNDPLERFCEDSFRDCPYPYGMRANVKYRYQGRDGEIDFLAWSDTRLYIIECKNAIMPTSSHEIRATYEHIKKASRQLDLSMEALSSDSVQKTYFSQWKISRGKRTIHTCILLGNRIFTVPNGLKHPIRYAYELNMVLTSGIINSNLGQWSCWADEQFSDNDLARFLSNDDPLSRSFIDAMKPYTETLRCQGKHIQLKSYIYNALLHLKKEDEYLRIINSNTEERDALKEQLCAQLNYNGF